ncbi:MAG: Glu-tRNA(Gln) amidotransferase subunit GatE [Desulfurococcales archaeon]|nr:Glu-tRNA(Gln) amidotransferase subunit GatE [Desulfurococcales archaeon]
MAPRLDYASLGLRVGLEVHQQLDTRHKLFCKCLSSLSEEEHDSFVRRLRPTRSELGDVDVAALFEWRKGRVYEYQAPILHSCLVESDEEPPHPLNTEALLIALAFAISVESWIPDEIHVMRKVVIDGSNTSGFQRTAVVALGGHIWVSSGKKVPLETIALEEDASRKIGDKGRTVTYRLDRLGIPLIEIATAPVIRDPEEAREVAEAIGRQLRLMGRVRRGIGTIRQDLNVSIEGGAKTEIKGVQRLDLIPKVIENEVKRQLSLLEIKRELEDRGVKASDLEEEPADVTEVFSETKSRVIRRAIEKGGRVLALKLRGFKGILGKEVMPGRRFGTELADYARFWGGVGGIFHSDELPGYGISPSELDRVYEALGADKGRDAVVLVADEKKRALKALSAVKDRAVMALRGVPEETRGAREDGTTYYLRPRPGSARMYPETDIPPIRVTSDLLETAEKLKPEPLPVKLEKLIKRHGLSEELAEEAIRDIRFDLIERLIDKYGDKIGAKSIVSLFVVNLRGLRREGVDVDSIPDDKLEEVISLIAEGSIAREAFESVVAALARNPNASVGDVVEELGVARISVEEASSIVERIIRENLDTLKSRGPKAFSVAMGLAMRELRGRIEGKIVAEIVKERLEKLLRP